MNHGIRLSRRTATRFLAGSCLAVAAFPISQPLLARQSESLERDPLVAAMEPTTIGENETFRANRGLAIILNTEDYTEQQAQNNLDLAIHEMFNVMYANRESLDNGQLITNLAQGYTPEGLNPEVFSELLSTSQPAELLIPTYFYPTGANDSRRYELGAFDPKLGVDVTFVDEPALFDISHLFGDQVFGYTPRISEDLKLSLEIYQNQSNFQEEPGFPADDQRSWAHTATLSSMLETMMISYGHRDFFHDANFGGAGYIDRIFNPPNFINSRIASLLSGTPADSPSFFSGVHQPYLLRADFI